MCDSKFKFISIVEYKYLTLLNCEIKYRPKNFICGNGLFNFGRII